MKNKWMSSLFALFLALIMVLNTGTPMLVEAAEGTESEAWYEYEGPSGGNILVGETYGIGRNVGYWGFDGEQDVNGVVPINNVEVIQQYVLNDDGGLVETEDTILSVQQTEDGIWYIQSEKQGAVKAACTFDAPIGEERTLEFYVYSLHQYYEIRIDYWRANNHIVLGETVYDYLYLFRIYQDEHSNHSEELVSEGVYFKVDEAQYDTQLVTASIDSDENGAYVAIEANANDKTGDGTVPVTAYSTEDNSRFIGAEVRFKVCDGFYNLEPPMLIDNDGNEVNTFVGQELDMQSLINGDNGNGPAIYYYSTENEEPEKMALGDEYRIRLGGYDGSAWDVKEGTEDDLIPVLIRKNADWTDFALIAERNDGTVDNPEWNMITERGYNQNWLDYAVWLEYDDDRIFAGQDKTYTINTDNISDKENCTVNVEVGIFDDEGNITPIDEAAYTVEKDADGMVTGITFDSEKLVSLMENGELRDYDWFDVKITVTVDGVELHGEGYSFNVRNTVYDYQFPEAEEQARLPYWGMWFDKNMNCYVENADIPGGKDFEVTVTNVTVDDETIIRVDAQEDGWYLEPLEKMGTANITLSYIPVDGDPDGTEERTHVMTVHVVDAIYSIGIPSDGRNVYLPGEEVDLSAEVYLECFSEDTGHYMGDTDDITVEWSVDDWLNDWKKDCVTLTQSGRNCNIKIAEDIEDIDFNVWVRAYKEADGKKEEVAVSNYWLEIRNDYHRINNEMERNYYIEADARQEMVFDLHHYYVDENGQHDESIAKDEVRYRINWDDNCFKLYDSNGDQLYMNEDWILELYDDTFEVLKLNNDYSRIHVWTERLNENGDYEEVAYDEFYFNGLNYDTWFDNLREDHYSWVFSDEDFDVLLNEENLSDKSEYSVEWVVGMSMDEEGNICDEIANTDEATYYTTDNTKLTLHGEALYSLFAEDAENRDIFIRYYVKIGSGDYEQVIQEDSACIAIREPYLEYLLPYPNAEVEPVEHVAGDSLVFAKIVRVYMENAKYPYGGIEEVDIKEAVLVQDGNAVELVSLGSRGWAINTKEVGSAVVSIFYPAYEGGKTYGHDININVVEKDEHLEYECSAGEIERVIPGGQIEYTYAYMLSECIDGKVVSNEMEGITYELSYACEDENQSVDDYVTIETKENGLVFTAKEDAGDMTIITTVVAKNADGEVVGEMQTSFYILSVDYDYYAVAMDDVLAAPGDVVDLPIVVKHYTPEHPEGVVVTDAEVVVDLVNENMFTVNGTKATITSSSLKETDPITESDFRIRFRIKDEDGREIYYEEITGILRICKHAWKETSKVAATCTKEGVSYQTCTKCGEKQEEAIKVVAHTVVTDAAKAPTCTATGLTEGTHCSVCNKVIKAQETVAKAPHTPTKTQTLATTGADGAIIEKCSVCGEEISKTTIPQPQTVKLSKEIFAYNKKKNQKPTVTVYDAEGNVIEASNYTVTYPKASKNIGRYELTITFSGNYSGTMKVTYDIAPKGTNLKKVQAGSKRFTAKWKKQAANTTGYLIQYSTDKNFKKNVKTATIKKNKTVSSVIKKLKGKKKYYVRICTYKNAKYKGKSVKICSAWSKAKQVTTKK